MLNKLFEGLKTVAAYALVFTVLGAMTIVIGECLGNVAVAGYDYIDSITPINYEEKMNKNLEATKYALGVVVTSKDDIEDVIGSEVNDSVIVDTYYDAICETEPLLIKYIEHPNLMNK